MHVSHLSAGRKVCQPKLHRSGTILNRFDAEQFQGRTLWIPWFCLPFYHVSYASRVKKKKSNQLFSRKCNRSPFTNSRSIPWVWLEKVNNYLSNFSSKITSTTHLHCQWKICQLANWLLEHTAWNGKELANIFTQYPFCISLWSQMLFILRHKYGSDSSMLKSIYLNKWMNK